MPKRKLGVDVLTAARQRIRAALEAAPRAYVSFSGGKDSTVLLDLVCREAREMGRTVGLLFVDLEAQYELTVAHVAASIDANADVLDPVCWVSLPLNLRNAVSVYEPHWTCWDPERRDDWVRKPPKRAIVDTNYWPWFKPGMEFEDFVPRFADWYAAGEDTVCFVGIRAQESLNRWRTIASSTKVRVNDWPWSTRKSEHVWNAYPIYDWATEDVWTYHAARPEMPSNGIYDLMHRAGLTIHQARICQPYGDDQRRGLWLFHLLEPKTWARVVARVNGANQGALYAQDSGNIQGMRKITCPEGHTWESFARMLLESMPKPTAEHYKDKVAVFLRWWELRGYPDGIPDAAEPKEEAAKRAPSWRRICKALLRNDYWCKGLSFTQSKNQDSYARYQTLMRDRRRRWGIWDTPDSAIPWKPTGRQLALIAALTGGSSPTQAWTALGRYLGTSAAAAKRNATRREASDCIAALKNSDGDYRAETFANAPKDKQGEPVRRLAGETNGEQQELF